jgi:hypothetical protein
VKPGRFILLGIVLVGLVVGIRRWRAHHATSGTSSPPGRTTASTKSDTARPTPLPDSAYNTHAPDSVHIKVEVINATDIRGLARRATLYLRDRGFDVVLIGGTKIRDNQTMVYDRSGHPEWARLVAKAMDGRMEVHPDTSRYVDVTVFLGKNWTPPAQPFYP